MSEDLKIDQDYKQAFNEGYELSKELGLKPEILDGLASGKGRMQAMRDGMQQYAKDLTMAKSKDKQKDMKSFDMDTFEPGIEPDLGQKTKDKDKGFDMEL